MAEVQVQMPTRRERQRADTRERLFDAAIAEFVQRGVADAQIPRIAQAAGVVRGTFYFHFPSKDHVLEELMNRHEAQVAEQLRALRGAGLCFREIFGHLIDAIESVAEGLEVGNLLREVMALYVRRPPSDDPSESALGVLQELAHHVGESAGRGELRSDIEAERLAAVVLTSIFGMVITQRDVGSDRRVGLDLLVDLLLPGLAPKPD